MKKKSLTLALALIMLLGVLSACGNTDPKDIGSALGDVSGVTAPPTPTAQTSAAPLPSLAPNTPDTQPSEAPDDGGQDVNLDDFLYDWLDFSGYPLTPDELIEFFGEPQDRVAVEHAI